METDTLLLGDGSKAVFEVEEIDRGPEHVGIGSVDDAKQKFKDAISGIGPMTEELLDSLRGTVQRPDSIEVQMSIKVSGELGAVVAKASTEGNFLVKIKWSGSQSD